MEPVAVCSYAREPRAHGYGLDTASQQLFDLLHDGLPKGLGRGRVEVGEMLGDIAVPVDGCLGKRF